MTNDPLDKIAATAPEHIWLDLGEEAHLIEEGTTFKDLGGVTWSEDNATGQGIKYVRAGASHTGEAEPIERFRPEVVIAEQAGRLTATGAAMMRDPGGDWVRFSDAHKTVAAPGAAIAAREQADVFAIGSDPQQTDAELQALERASHEQKPAWSGSTCQCLGWKSVPIEPTDEMLNAFQQGMRREFGMTITAGYHGRIYRAMLDAAPVAAPNIDTVLRDVCTRFLACIGPDGYFPSAGKPLTDELRAALSHPAPVAAPAQTNQEKQCTPTSSDGITPSSACAGIAGGPPSATTSTDTQTRDAWRGGSSYEASMLRNLLARIHGDGGHYLEQHGLDKALEDADLKVANWRAAPAQKWLPIESAPEDENILIAATPDWVFEARQDLNDDGAEQVWQWVTPDGRLLHKDIVPIAWMRKPTFPPSRECKPERGL